MLFSSGVSFCMFAGLLAAVIIVLDDFSFFITFGMGGNERIYDGNGRELADQVLQILMEGASTTMN